MVAYIALLRKDTDSDFGVEFPDFPGCVTAGSTLDEARKEAAKALRFHAEGLAEDGAAIPQPSSLDAIMRHRENSDAVAFLVDLPTEGGRQLYGFMEGSVVGLDELDLTGPILEEPFSAESSALHE
jgi:predicted RNase H-like HicB family nuclease